MGENGVVNQATASTLSTKIAGYKEEYEMNVFGKDDENPIPNRSKINVLNEGVREYIPSLKDIDVGKFGIIAGELYYLGDDASEIEVCQKQGLKIKSDGQSMDDFFAVAENNALENIVKNMGGKPFKNIDSNGNEKNVGNALKNKEVGVSSWKLIKEISDNITIATYGTDWYLVEKGTNINGIGVLKNSYIINYKTGKAVKFDANKHTILSDELKLEGEDSLLCAVDARMLEDYNMLTEEEKITFDASKLLGLGVTLIGYDGTDGSIDYSKAFGQKQFTLDGVDDCLKINFDSLEKKNMLKNNGFTFEFFGTYNSGESYPGDNGVLGETAAKGLFCFENSNGDNWNHFRFFARDNGKRICWNAGISGLIYSDYSDKRANPWSIFYPESELVSNGKEIYLTITLDTRSENTVETNDDDDSKDKLNNAVGTKYYHHACFINGNLMWEGNFAKSNWDAFISGIGTKADFYIGRACNQYKGSYHYSKMDCKTLRLYATGLTADQVMANYRATVGLYNNLENGGNSSTSGATGGEDLGNIN